MFVDLCKQISSLLGNVSRLGLFFGRTITTAAVMIQGHPRSNVISKYLSEGRLAKIFEYSNHTVRFWTFFEQILIGTSQKQ